MKLTFKHDNNYNKVDIMIYNIIEQNFNRYECVQNIDTGFWEFEFEKDKKDDVIYKFVIDDSFMLNDPNASKYYIIEANNIWSVLESKKINKRMSCPHIHNIKICTDVDLNYNPVNITNTITSNDSKVFCWAHIYNLNRDCIFTSIWKDSKGNILSGVDIFIDFVGRNERKVFTGIEFHQLLSNNIVCSGKYNIDIYLNGAFIVTLNYNVKKYEIYSYSENKISKKVL